MNIFSGTILKSMRFNAVALCLMQICAPLHFFVNSYTPRSLRKEISQSNRAFNPMTKKSWVDRFGQVHERTDAPNDALKIVSYNVLGPVHGEGSKHAYAPVSVTKWSRRRDKLLEELREMKADIFCLQEVSEKGLSETFIPGLQRIGLRCTGFAPTKSRNRHVRGKYGHKSIGSAIFCNSEKLEVLSSKRVHLKDFAPLDNCRSHEFHVDVHGKWNSMVMMYIRMKETNQTAVVANTHLFWDPEREDIKTVQAYAVADALSRFSVGLGYNRTELPPLILCGDFNGLPYRMQNEFDSGIHNTALFKLLGEGKLSDEHPEHPDRWHTSVPARPVCPRLGPLQIDWKLQNAHTMTDFDEYAPLFTTKTDEFQGWIDHIWVCNKVQVDMVMVPPIRKGDLTANTQSREFGPIPNAEFPSDHIPIGIIARVQN